MTNSVLFRIWTPAYVALLLMVVAQPLCQDAGAALENAPTHSPVCEFLALRQPVIERMVFQKDLFLPDIPANARSQRFLLRINGDDCWMSILSSPGNDPVGAYYGMFQGRSWELTDGELTYSDPALNQTATPVSALTSVVKTTGAVVLNLGMTELLRSSLTWDSYHGQFLARLDDGRDVIIAFEPSYSLPDRAIIRSAANNRELAYVDYQYSTQFLNGTFPFRFTRHLGSPGHDLGPQLAVELFALELATNPLPESIMNPAVVFHSRTWSFYSNNDLYVSQGHGAPQKVLTAAEYQTWVKSHVKLKHPVVTRSRILAATIILVLAFLVLRHALKNIARRNP